MGKQDALHEQVADSNDCGYGVLSSSQTALHQRTDIAAQAMAAGFHLAAALTTVAITHEHCKLHLKEKQAQQTSRSMTTRHSLPHRSSHLVNLVLRQLQPDGALGHVGERPPRVAALQEHFLHEHRDCGKTQKTQYHAELD